MRDFENTEEWRKGKKAENIISRALKDIGWHIIATSEFSKSGAPMLEGAHSKVAVLPDLDTSRRGTRRWVESKGKKDRAFFRIWRKNVHGISLKHYNAYNMVERETGTPVWIFVYEFKRNNILCAPLSKLKLPGNMRVYTGKNEQDEGGNVYFDIAAFTLFGIPPQPGEMFELKDGQWLPSWVYDNNKDVG